MKLVFSAAASLLGLVLWHEHAPKIEFVLDERAAIAALDRKHGAERDRLLSRIDVLTHQKGVLLQRAIPVNTYCSCVEETKETRKNFTTCMCTDSQRQSWSRTSTGAISILHRMQTTMTADQELGP